MKRTTAAIATAIVLVAGLVGYRVYRIVQERGQIAAGNEKGKETLRVEAHRVRTADLTRSVPITGDVEALSAVDVVPKVSGRLERLRLLDGRPVEEGTPVKKGQVIAVVEHEALKAAVDTARAAVAVAKAQGERVKVKLQECGREKKRWEGLFKAGSATAQQRDRAVDANEMCLAESKLAESQIAQAEAAVRQAEVTLREATIRAPIDGVVSVKHVDEGDMAVPGRPLVRIVQIDSVKVVGGVSERHLAWLVPGKTPAWTVLDVYPGEEFKGVVSKVGTAVDRRMRTVSVETRIENPGHRLRPGMFARLKLILERRENVPVVPEEALLRQGDEPHVFVVNGAKAHRRVLKLGLSEGAWHEVLEGLAPGDLVIVKGQHSLEDGDAVVAEEGAR